MTKKLYLSIDLGGTSFRIALMDSKAHCLAQKRLSAEKIRSPEQLVPLIAQECQQMQARAGERKGRIQGVALGIPGLVDSQRGIVYQSPHFPKWREIALQAPLQAQLHMPVFVENDANQAALGEAWLGAGKNWPDFIMITLGTGVGGGIILDGNIFHGPIGFAGEIGHIVIDRNGLPGAVGSHGTLETLASQSGLRLQLEALLKNLKAKTKQSAVLRELQKIDSSDRHFPEKLYQLAQDGNKIALALWDDVGKALACGITSLVHTMGVLRYVIGGGLLGAWDLFAESCRQEIPHRTYKMLAPKIEFVPAKLGNQAGLVGGVRKIQQMLGLV